jgi:hypothetical protein
VLNESYLYTLIRYIEQNPLKAGIVRELRDWPYSGYRAFAGLESPIACLKGSIIFREFGGAGEAAAFFDTVVNDESAEALFEMIKNEAKAVENKETIAPRPEFRLAALRRAKTKAKRDSLIKEALLAGYSQSTIAEAAGMTQANVSRIIRKEDR